MDKAKQLQEWYFANKNNLATGSNQNLASAATIQFRIVKISDLTANLGKNGTNNFKIFGIISCVRIIQTYKACLQCNKKWVKVDEFNYTCEKC